MSDKYILCGVKVSDVFSLPMAYGAIQAFSEHAKISEIFDDSVTPFDVAVDCINTHEKLVEENQELADALRVCVDALEMMVSKHNDVPCGSDNGLRLSCPPAERARKLLDGMDD